MSGKAEIDNDIEKRHEMVTQKLNVRESERLALIDRRELDKEANKVEHEEVQTFIRNLNDEKEVIESLLSTASNMSKPEVRDLIDVATKQCHKLQKYVADSRIFLPSYNIRKAQEIVSALLNSVQYTHDLYVPSKKFAFRKKKSSEPQVPSTASKQVNEEKNVINDNIDIVNGCGFQDQSGELLQMHGAEVAGKDVCLTKLKSSKVYIEGSPSTVQMSRLNDCNILIGPVATSIFIEDCHRCQFVLACQQLRIHSTTDCKFYIHVTSRAIIEDSNNVKFAPYNWTYPLIQEHYEASGLNQAVNNWDIIHDFNWLSSSQPSPNWSILKEEERTKNWCNN